MSIIHIDNIRDEKLLVFYAYKENQLFHYNEPNPGIFIAESPEVIKRAISAGYEPEAFLIETEQMKPEILSIANDFEVPIYACSYENLKHITGYHMSRGMLCAFKRRWNPKLSDVCEGKRRIVVLENIMNPTNVGAIIRSAAALNIDAAILSAGCADPLQRRASRVSMGNIFSMPWAYMDTVFVDMKMLKSLGYKTIALAIRDDAIPIDRISVSPNEKIAIILGTEGNGLSKKTIEASDIVTLIPMSAGVDSLNVAAASAVAFWQI